ncbi:MAG TPA: lipid-binding SYLF domain-containing protein [Candidatus Acidoferrales bacterium]|nr:lipid-binding SYLF domain-containing protein [Candidatus Acidoferrales bacterium]
MRKSLILLIAVVLTSLPAFFAAAAARAADKSENNDQKRLGNAGTVMKEILDIPDDIPQDLIDKAECVIVYPSVLKAAFGIGASYGRGAMTCRTGDEFKGPWGAPTMMRLEGLSIGFQLGGQATDFVLLVMNKRGANAILSSKVKLGADAAAAAGPKGRNAEASTDVSMRAEILTYSRSRGLFAGVSLAGSTLRPDNGANTTIYGHKVAAKDIVLHGAVGVPASGRLLVDTLQKHSPVNKSDAKSLKD